MAAPSSMLQVRVDVRPKAGSQKMEVPQGAMRRMLRVNASRETSFNARILGGR